MRGEPGSGDKVPLCVRRRITGGVSSTGTASWRALCGRSGPLPLCTCARQLALRIQKMRWLSSEQLWMRTPLASCAQAGAATTDDALKVANDAFCSSHHAVHNK